MKTFIHSGGHNAGCREYQLMQSSELLLIIFQNPITENYVL
jgi:hypothetical protein